MDLEKVRGSKNMCWQPTANCENTWLPLWIIRFDLLKTFDKVDLEAMRFGATCFHDMYMYFVYTMRTAYTHTLPKKSTNILFDSCQFGIRKGVQEGCPVSSSLVCSILELFAPGKMEAASWFGPTKQHWSLLYSCRPETTLFGSCSSWSISNLLIYFAKIIFNKNMIEIHSLRQSNAFERNS